MVGLLEEYLKRNKLSIPLYITEIQNNERAMKANDLANLFTVPTTVYANLQEILRVLPDLVEDKEKPCVICGSLYLLSEFFKQYPEKLQLAY